MLSTKPPISFPGRLHHTVPSWIKQGCYYHIRIRADKCTPFQLIDDTIAKRLLDSACYYHQHKHWHCLLILIMPDHLHAIISFPPNVSMSATIGNWKRSASKFLGIKWQKNFFDHRIRTPDELSEKYSYILRNPVVKALCASENDWPWRWEQHRSADLEE